MTNKTKASINESAIDKAKYELHMRRIAAIDEAATKAWEADARHNPNPNNPYAYVYGFKAGAQTILDAPGEWGLITLKESNILFADNMDLVKAETSKYRSALERIVNDSGCHLTECIRIAKEALKQ